MQNTTDYWNKNTLLATYFKIKLGWEGWECGSEGARREKWVGENKGNYLLGVLHWTHDVANHPYKQQPYSYVTLG